MGEEPLLRGPAWLLAATGLRPCPSTPRWVSFSTNNAREDDKGNPALKLTKVEDFITQRQIHACAQTHTHWGLKYVTLLLSYCPNNELEDP